MSLVVLVGTAPPPRLALEAALPALAARGARVEVLLARDVRAPLDGLPVSGCRVLRLPPRLRLRVLQRLSGRALRTWRLVREDPQAMALLAGADAVVALDLVSAFAVWKAHRCTGVPAWSGVAAYVEETA